MAGRRILLACLAVVVAAPAQAQPSQLETAVKATYLYKLAPFVEWPADDSAGPFTICVVGPDPFGPLLDKAVAGQAYDGRPFAVTRTATLTAPDTCEIAYAGGTAQQVAATLRAAEGHPVLTVTDGSQAAGMVNFTLHQGKVRFRIDQAATEASGLTVSSKLLSLALSVHPAKGRP
ncbi:MULTISPECIES: YfiR family protein [Asticcacaulis]|uniref:YfiR family protein n=1 Tax=Asticcacaulis TaxID=76890 RepID=UPI001AE24BBB|nr:MULTISPECIES: YfiR family protein [Asticcacaulis]MBP2159293.1 hypothetical protein [Asticcacaulis solisilvae]MDR6800338.1 hypothetical protein [Asticcacaulis sp. BE141]